MSTPRKIPITRSNNVFSDREFELEINMVIYKTTNLINGKIYVGQDSKNNPEYLGSGVIIKKAISKYGKENFKKEILEVCLTKEELDIKEQYWIKELNSIDVGYNVSSGGGGCLGCKDSDETKNKKRLSRIGGNNPMYGKTLPIEVLIKRSEKVKEEGTFKGDNNPNFKYKIIKEELYDLFIIKNLKIDEISKIYGCHRTVISNNLKKYNIKKEPSNIYKLNINEIYKYIDNGMNLVQIGLIYGCSNKIIHKYIKKHKK
jgi:group I intron endonuclease